ncbi:hypothetical protein llap_7034 [Limosa lapponica baueri]|uniref:Uncharacterized protein n=1 Tax=Limosa lapponica baueri TaxID=1758121 RepID=A0A2I0U9B6_LIMLA|nr:hypothetical protein llap_7034 [Limosa lapponica baueri]
MHSQTLLHTHKHIHTLTRTHTPLYTHTDTHALTHTPPHMHNTHIPHTQKHSHALIHPSTHTHSHTTLHTHTQINYQLTSDRNGTGADSYQECLDNKQVTKKKKVFERELKRLRVPCPEWRLWDCVGGMCGSAAEFPTAAIPTASPSLQVVALRMTKEAE